MIINVFVDWEMFKNLPMIYTIEPCTLKLHISLRGTPDSILETVRQGCCLFSRHLRRLYPDTAVMELFHD